MQRRVGVAAPDRLDEGADHIVVLVAVPVVADGGAVHRAFQGGRVDVRRAERGGLEVGEGAPAVAAREPDELLKRFEEVKEVVDAAVMPMVPSSNIHPATIMVAERGADFIAKSLRT